VRRVIGASWSAGSQRDPCACPIAEMAAAAPAIRLGVDGKPVVVGLGSAALESTEAGRQPGPS
jgi:hypothetical protein